MKNRPNNPYPNLFITALLLLMALPSLLHAQCTKDPGVLTISSGTTANWSGFNFLSVDVRVDSNATLNIYGTNSIYAGVTIEVMPGGRLNIDSGATLTSACTSGMWNGIVLHGNYNRVQASGGSYDPSQAVMIMDSGTISWAKLGVQVDSGAVFKARVSTFSNCRNSIKFTDYEPLNISRLDSCDFYCNDTLPGYEGNSIDNFIYIHGIKNLQINGCSFINETPDGKLVSTSNGKNRGEGIISIDASYKLQRGGPSQLLQNGCIAYLGKRNHFEGLQKGIYHRSIKDDYQLNVQGSLFKNIQAVSIYVIGAYNSIIYKNRFLYDSDYHYDSLVMASLSNRFRFIYLIRNRGFSIDSNSFELDTLIGKETIYGLPIEVSNSGHFEATIYNNYFYNNENNFNLTMAISLGDMGTNDRLRGHINSKIKFICNEFNNYTFDAYIAGTIYPFNDIGSDSLDAGNKFSLCSFGSSRISIANDMIYLGNDSDPIRFPSNCVDPDVTLEPVGVFNNCDPTGCLVGDN